MQNPLPVIKKSAKKVAYGLGACGIWLCAMPIVALLEGVGLYERLRYGGELKGSNDPILGKR